MKHRGNTSDFIAHRDLELHRSFMEVLGSAAGVPLREMFALAAQRPASRFWVSEGRACVVIGAMRRGVVDEKMISKRREMFEEIYRRVCVKMEADPNLCLTHAVNETIYEPAPEFYLTPESARSIIYRRRRKARQLKFLKTLANSYGSKRPDFAE